MKLPDGNIVIRASIINGEWSLSQVILGGGWEFITQEKCAVCPGKSLRFAGCFSNGDKPVDKMIIYRQRNVLILLLSFNSFIYKVEHTC